MENIIIVTGERIISILEGAQYEKICRLIAMDRAMKIMNREAEMSLAPVNESFCREDIPIILPIICAIAVGVLCAIAAGVWLFYMVIR